MTSIVTRADKPAPNGVHLSELLGALSHALDLTEGQPPGHCVRATWIAMHVGQQMGLPQLQLWELYYTTMLKDLGCSSNAARICELYLSDDLGFKRDFKTLSDSLPKVLGFVFSHTGLKAGLAERFKAISSRHVVSGAPRSRSGCGSLPAYARQSTPSTSTGTARDGPTISPDRPSRSMRASPCWLRSWTCSTRRPDAMRR